MIGAVFLTALTALVPSGTRDGVAYRDLSVDVEGELLDARFVQIEGDDRPELVLVTRSRVSGKREIQIYVQAAGPREPTALSSTPWRSIPVFEDVIAYSVADVREDPGDELLFFTRGGVFAMSPREKSLRGNIRRLVAANLVYEVPDPTELFYWNYVIRGDRDSIVVPGEHTFSVWGPPREGTGPYLQLAEFSDFVNAGSRDEQGEVEIEQEATLTVAGSTAQVSRKDSDASRILIETDHSKKRSLLSFDRKYPAPALADVDGDGEEDLIVLSKSRLRVFISEEGRVPARASRVEKLPGYISKQGVVDASTQIRLVDIDRDGDADLFVQVMSDPEDGGLVSSTFNLLFLRNDGARLLPDQPDQLMRFEALELRVEITDVDGDGTPDLVARKFEVPSVVDVVTSLDFTHTTLVFPGSGKPGGRVFARRPVLKQEQVYDEDSVGDVIARRKLIWDCSGDGVADLVEIDVQGRVGVRLVKRESGFFSGDTWTLDRDPWKRFETMGSIQSLLVDDLNGDGLGDIVSRRSDGVLLLFSQRPGGPR